jgi:hypothetical protein
MVRRELPSPPVPEAVREFLTEELARGQKGARARRIERVPEDIVTAICTTRAGWAEVDGGGIPYSYRYSAETTVLTVHWWRRAGVVRIWADARRAYAPRVPYGRCGECRVREEPLWYVLERAWPERAEALRCVVDQRNRRYLERRGLPVPPHDLVGRVVDLMEGACAVFTTLVTPYREDAYGTWWLCVEGSTAPLRLVAAPRSEKMERLLRDPGSPFPRQLGHRILTGNISLEDLQAELVLLSLGGRS